jgi:UDP-N-acetylglucosamine:LPS N-acetylglucosamine transferase
MNEKDCRVEERKSSSKRILAVASEGGHWVQLKRLAPAFQGHEVTYVTTNPSYGTEVDEAGFHTVQDASRWNKLMLVKQALQMFWIMIRCRPHLIISTGAAPGYFAIRLGKLLGAKCIWIDSIANAEKLSLSGRKVGAHADLSLTQWPHLARTGGPNYHGTVL